jgi:hypothetical protein
MSPQIVVGIFGSGMVALAIWKPQICRNTMGIFFLLMALGVNLPLLLTNPGLYPLAGSHALIGIYRWFFTAILPIFPEFFISGLIIIEVTIGILILAKNQKAKLGIISGILFCVLIVPVGIEEITAPLIGLALALLLRKQYPNSFLDLVFRNRLIKENA